MYSAAELPPPTYHYHRMGDQTCAGGGMTGGRWRVFNGIPGVAGTRTLGGRAALNPPAQRLNRDLTERGGTRALGRQHHHCTIIR